MAVTTDGIDKAEIALCVEIAKGNKRPLPWAFVKFADASETARYVMPASNGLFVLAAQPWRVTEEAMRDAPFPHETDFPPKPSSGDAAKLGPQAVHYFGAGI